MSDLDVAYQWVAQFDAAAQRDVAALIASTVADGGTLGYMAALSAEQRDAFFDALQRRIDQGQAHALLGRVGAEPAFFVILSPNPMPNCRHRAELSKGVVAPAFRGRHLVALGLREIVRKAQALGVEQLELDVREGSRAHALWQYYGFDSWGVLEDYARVGGVSHAGHYMSQTVRALAERLTG